MTTSEASNLLASVPAWFLGPKSENLEIFKRLAVKVFEENADFRRTYYPSDYETITYQNRNNSVYKDEVIKLEKELDDICKALKTSLPSASIRMQGHMIADSVLPGYLGYLSALLYNANNHVVEAGPATVSMEIEVGQQLCEMLGYDINGYPKPWGHITCGGTVSNIEAVWSCRNVKYYPFAVQKAIVENKELLFLQEYKVFVPRINCMQALLELKAWDLLNLEIDDIIQMQTDIAQLMHSNKYDPNKYMNLIENNTLAKLGWYIFMKTFGLYEQGVICIPATSHYSWLKAASLTGIGERGLKIVACDEYARMDITELRRVLSTLMERKVPVISVVAVIGSTESSAVDALDEIVKLRTEFREKGLNFAVNTDAAWGGYFTLMLQEGPDINRHTVNECFPLVSLNAYTRKQLLALKHADTITVDPHKSGFIPYPAGVLCYRNGNMKDFVQNTSLYLNHSESDPNPGKYGLQGSKPGATAASILLANKVIGLNKYGYGTILGLCNIGAKLLYCCWLTLDKDEDNFVCVPLQPLPNNMNLEDAKSFIESHIKGKPYSEIAQNEEAMSFLEEVGPDLCINGLTVNPKINGKKNTDIKICNQVNKEIFSRLSIINNNTKLKRIPLIVTISALDAVDHERRFQNFTQRLGLCMETNERLSFLRSTVMNPWTSDEESRDIIMSVFRQTVLDSVGTVMDEHHRHTFITSGLVSEDKTIFAEYNSAFHVPYRQYHSVVKFQFVNETDADIFRQHQERGKKNPPKTRQPLFIQSHLEDTLGSFLKKAEETPCTVNCYNSMPAPENAPFLKEVEISVVDIPRFRHLDPKVTNYPENLTYFMYGDQYGVHLSHAFQCYPDFIQVVDLIRKPETMDDIFIDRGIDVIIPEISGNLKGNETIHDPLIKPTYRIEYTGYNGQLGSAEIEIDHERGKIWFDSDKINNYTGCY